MYAERPPERPWCEWKAPDERDQQRSEEKPPNEMTGTVEKDVLPWHAYDCPTRSEYLSRLHRRDKRRNKPQQRNRFPGGDDRPQRVVGGLRVQRVAPRVRCQFILNR
jgi:hypothetical protein